jgi:HK97 family phage major capsid protein
MKKISDQIDALAKKRGLKVSALEELMEKADAANREFDADEATAYDQLETDVNQIDSHLKRLQGLEDTIARTATPVARPSRENGSRNAKLAKGVGFARIAQLIAASQGNDLIAQRLAQQHYGDAPDLSRYFEGRASGVIARAATTAATTQDPAWAGVLTYAAQLSSELIELIYAESVLGQLTRMRNVPFNVRIPRETAIVGSAMWVGEGLPKPVGKGGYDFVTMPWAKAALIVAITDELARFSNPAADVLIRDSLVRAVAQFLDTQFVGAGAPVAGVSPGGILNGLPAGQLLASAGAGLAAMQYDVTNAVSVLTAIAAPRAPIWLMSPTNRTALEMQINAFGQSAFPSIGASGTLAGYPIAVSAFVPNNEIILMDQDKILHASDPSIAVDVSREASIQIDTAPANPPTPLVSLWQQNMIGLRAEKYEYWMRARDNGVVVLTGVNYLVLPAPGAFAAAQANANDRAASERNRAHKGE